MSYNSPSKEEPPVLLLLHFLYVSIVVSETKSRISSSKLHQFLDVLHAAALNALGYDALMVDLTEMLNDLCSTDFWNFCNTEVTEFEFL